MFQRISPSNRFALPRGITSRASSSRSHSCFTFKTALSGQGHRAWAPSAQGPAAARIRKNAAHNTKNVAK